MSLLPVGHVYTVVQYTVCEEGWAGGGHRMYAWLVNYHSVHSQLIFKIIYNSTRFQLISHEPPELKVTWERDKKPVNFRQVKQNFMYNYRKCIPQNMICTNVADLFPQDKFSVSAFRQLMPAHKPSPPTHKWWGGALPFTLLRHVSPMQSGPFCILLFWKGRWKKHPKCKWTLCLNKTQYDKKLKVGLRKRNNYKQCPVAI